VNSSVYAKPVVPRIVVRPALATVALHALVIYLLTANFDFGEREVTRVKPMPKAINARLVDVSELQPKPKPQPRPQPKPKPPAPKPEPKPAPKPEPKPEPKPAPKPTPKPAPKPAAKPQPKPEPKPEPRISSAELAAIARSELSQAVEAESQQQAASATADEMAASFAALIQQTVVNSWSRPPSARNGLEVLLSIQLIPTGEVVSVQVLKSSGNNAFDRSAVNAVEKAGAFPELQKLPSGEFEKTFRRFRLLFRPEDLRY